MEDWKRHTEYSGAFEDLGPYHPTCQRFWEGVTEFDKEMRARLLQFTLGSSGVPSRGLGDWQGMDGSTGRRKVTIHGVPLRLYVKPRTW